MKQLYKFLSLLFALLLLCPATLSPARAEAFDMSQIEEPYVYVFDASNPNQSILGLERNADAKMYPASTTKILTCIIALEYAASEGHSLDEAVKISENATDFGTGNSLMGVYKDEEFTLRDILYGLMLVSGNDAAVALAEHISESESSFAVRMNEKAAAIGMSSSHFVTPHGKHKAEHYSTARDMGLLTAYALENIEFRQIVATPTYTAIEMINGREIDFVNSNRLIVNTPGTEDNPSPISCLYESAIGVKTGDTNQAGKCVVAAAERGGVRLVAMLFGGTLNDSYYMSNQVNMKAPAKEPYNARRFEDAILLFEYAFGELMESYTVADLVNKGLPTEFNLQVQNAAEQDEEQGQLRVQAVLDSNKTVQMMRTVREALEADIANNASIVYYKESAPISMGETIGRVDYQAGGAIILSADLIATRAVAESIINTAPENTEASGDSLFTTPSPAPIDQGGNTGKLLTIILIIVCVVLVLLLALVMIRRAIMLKRRRAQAEARRKRKQAETKRRNEMEMYGYTYHEE